MTTTERVILDGLIAAKRILIIEGWIQGGFHRRGALGGFCAVGALREAFGCQSGTRPPEYYDANSTLQSVVPSRFGGHIVEFNDDCFTQQTDVIAAYDAAIARVYRRIQERDLALVPLLLTAGTVVATRVSQADPISEVEPEPELLEV